MGGIYTARNDPRGRENFRPWAPSPPLTEKQRQDAARRTARSARWFALSVELGLASVQAEKSGRLHCIYPLT